MQEKVKKEITKLFAGFKLLTVRVALLLILFGGALLSFILIAK